MTNQTPKIVVITPLKNEDWIIDRFLAVTSQFADRIIIADQNSTDESLAICKKYVPRYLYKTNCTDYPHPDYANSDNSDRRLRLLL